MACSERPRSRASSTLDPIYAMSKLTLLHNRGVHPRKCFIFLPGKIGMAVGRPRAGQAVLACHGAPHCARLCCPLLRSSAAPPACAQDGPIVLELPVEASTLIRPGGAGWPFDSRTAGVPRSPFPSPAARLSLTILMRALPRCPQELLVFLERRPRSSRS